MNEMCNSCLHNFYTIEQFIRLNVESDVGHLDRQRVLEDNCHRHLLTKSYLVCGSEYYGGRKAHVHAVNGSMGKGEVRKCV